MEGGSRSSRIGTRMAFSHLCTFLVEEKVCAWGWGAQWKHPIHRSAKARLGASKPNTASCLHGLTLESSLSLYLPSSLFCLPFLLPQRNPLKRQKDHTSPLLKILIGRLNVRALTTSQASPTSLVFHAQLSSHQSPETHSLPIWSF